MSTLAFTARGDSFEVPETVTDWRVRRLRPRGAPELVYGRDGLPLAVPIECDIAMLRDAVAGVLGRYRLDPLDADGKPVDGVPAAYVRVVEPEPEPEPPGPPGGPHALDPNARLLLLHGPGGIAMQCGTALRAPPGGWGDADLSVR